MASARTKSRSKKRPSNANRLTLASRADGSSSLDANGAAVPAAVAVVLVLGLLIFAREHAWVTALVTGAGMGSGVIWFGWSLLTGRIAWSQAWDGSRLRANQRKDGSLDISGWGAAAWPVAALVVLFGFYVLAPTAIKVLWISLGGTIVFAIAVSVLLRKSRRQGSTT